MFICLFVCDRCGNNYRAAQSLSPTRAAEANIGICIQNKGLSRTTHKEQHDDDEDEDDEDDEDEDEDDDGWHIS